MHLLQTQGGKTWPVSGRYPSRPSRSRACRFACWRLIDVKRSTSYTRYYLAERLGGNPADMGWDSQAVMLVPSTQLGMVLTNKNDHPTFEALTRVHSTP